MFCQFAERIPAFINVWFAIQIWVMKLYCVGDKIAFCMMILQQICLS